MGPWKQGLFFYAPKQFRQICQVLRASFVRSFIE